MPISGEEYTQIGRSAAGAVSIVAAYDKATDVIVGLTASSFVTLSFDPPLVMFALQQQAASYTSMVASYAFGVSLLGHTQSELAKLFSRKGREKADKSRFEEGRSLHVPLIPHALAQMECITSQIHISGDHAIIVGMVEAARTNALRPLLYFAREYGSFTPLAKL